MRPKNKYRLDDNDLSPSSNIVEIAKQIVELRPESEKKSLEPLITQLLQLVERRDIENEKHCPKRFSGCISILEDAVENLENSSSGTAIHLIDVLSTSSVACDEFLLIVLYECAGNFDEFASWFSRSLFDYDRTTRRYRTVQSGVARNLIYEIQSTYRKKQESSNRVLSQMVDVFCILLTSDVHRRLDQSDMPQSGYLSIEFLIEVGHHSVFEEIIHELAERIDQTQQSFDGPNVDALKYEVLRLIKAADDVGWKAKSLSLPVQEPDDTRRTWGEYFQERQDDLHNNIESTKCTSDALQLATNEAHRFDDYQRALAKVLVVHQANIVDDSLISLARSEAQAADGMRLMFGDLGILRTVRNLDVLKKALEDKHLPTNKRTITLPNSTSSTLYFCDLITHVVDSMSDSREKLKALWFLRQVKLSLNKPMKDINEIFDGEDKISLHSLYGGFELSQDDWLNASSRVTADILKAIDRWDTSITSLIEAIVEDMPLTRETHAILYKQVILHALDENSFPHFYPSYLNEDECEVEHRERRIWRELCRFADCINETLPGFVSDKNSVLKMQCFVNKNISENHLLIRLLRALAEYVYPDNPCGVLQAAQPWSGLIDEQIPYIISGYDSNKYPKVNNLLNGKLEAAW